MLEYAAKLDKAAKYEATAVQLLGEGFTTAASQKRAREAATRAYQEVRGVVMAMILAHKQKGTATKAQDALYWAIPEAHQFRAGTALLIRDGLPEAEAQVVVMERLTALMAAIKAAPIVKPEKKPEVIQPGDKTQLRGHCQCCGRVQAVTNGFIAQHGYRVKQGTFMGVCTGRHDAPLEQDRARTDRWIEQWEAEAARHDADAADLSSGKKVPKKARTSVSATAEWVDFKDAPAHMQKQSIQMCISSAQQSARQLRSHVEFMRALADSVHGKQLQVVKL